MTEPAGSLLADNLYLDAIPTIVETTGRFIETLGAQRLPCVWSITALAMVVFITYYHRLVMRHSRINVVMGTCLVISGLLVLFRILLNFSGLIVPITLVFMYSLISSVVLVEQFWSLTNAVCTTRDCTNYGFTA